MGLMGYNGYIRISDGQHSFIIDKPSEFVIKSVDGTTTKVYVGMHDFGEKHYSNYHGRFVPCVFGHSVKKGKKLIREERYGVTGRGYYRDRNIYIPYAKGTWTGRHGEIVKRATLLGNKGICRTRYSRGQFMGQRFIYSNGFTAYSFGRYDTNCVVKYPDGKIAYEYKFNTPICDIMSKRNSSQAEQVRNGDPLFFNINIVVDHIFVHYDRKGRIKAKGEFKDRQQTGEWVKDYREQYFVNGLMVDKKLYFAKPEEIDPKRVLREKNAQFRALLLKKIGLERVVKECKGKLIDRDNGNALYDFPVRNRLKQYQGNTNYSKDADRYDETHLRILKVICPSTKNAYFLRVPALPDFATCEKARQGTFNGFDRQAKPIEFALET